LSENLASEDDNYMNLLYMLEEVFRINSVNMIL